MGCEKGIRNLVTHGGRKPDQQTALEMLAALSMLARWIDEAEGRDSVLKVSNKKGRQAFARQLASDVDGMTAQVKLSSQESVRESQVHL